MKIAIIIPTYNEEQNIRLLTNKIFNLNLDINIIFVDSASYDNTINEINNIIRIYKNKVFLIQQKEKQGLGSAYIEGFRFALTKDFDLICEMDADLSHDPKELINFYNNINGYDIVVGSRYIENGKILNWPFKRRLISYIGNFIGRFPVRFKVKDVTTGYRMYKRRAIESLDLDSIESQGYGFQLEILIHSLRNSFRIKEIPIIFKDRIYGESKLGKKDFGDYIKVILKYLIR